MNLIIRIKINLLEPAHRHAGIHYYNIWWRPLLVFLGGLSLHLNHLIA